jgi:hypothetical protein
MVLQDCQEEAGHKVV